MTGRYILGIILVSVVAYFIGKLLTKIVGRKPERGIIGCVFWGALVIWVIYYHHPVAIILFLIFAGIFL